MSLRDRFLLFFAFFALALLAGCGTSAPVAVAPPTGAFSNSSLKGTYVFSFSGTDITNSVESFFALAGTLTANGSGGFSSGTIDINDPALEEWLGITYVPTSVPITTGSYSITADGRGSGTITVTIAGKGVSFGLDFVLITPSQGLIIRFDGNGTGSGTIDLQTSVAQSALQGSYAFSLGGVDSLGYPLSYVGSFTLNSAGSASGLQDFNDNKNSAGLTALPLQSGSTVLVGAPSGRAQLVTGVEGFPILNFDVWVIDSTHLKFIETDAVAVLAGDAFVSTGHTSFPPGQLVFTMTGLDLDTSVCPTYGCPLVSGGLLTSDGSSLITGGLEDINDDGAVVEAPSINGNFSSSGGRAQLTLNNIYNGGVLNNPMVTGSYTFAAYPYNGGIVLLEIDNVGITGGTAYVQSATSIATSQGYGLNLTGVNSQGEVDLIAEFTATSSALTGLYDVNNLTLLASDLSLGTGSYSVNTSNGRGVASFPSLQTSANSVIPALGLTFYVLNSSTAVFIETDYPPTVYQVAAGIFQQQSASGVSPAVLPRFALMQPKSPHMSRGRQK